MNTNNRTSRVKRSHLTAAFTLLEIMVVVVIIGILTTIVIMKVGNQTTQAKITATEATIGTIRTAIGQYEMEKGKFPESIADLVTGEKHFLDRESVPTDSWKHEFKYYMKGDLVKVRSAGPDGVFDTEDDIENKQAYLTIHVVKGEMKSLYLDCFAGIGSELFTIGDLSDSLV